MPRDRRLPLLADASVFVEQHTLKAVIRNLTRAGMLLFGPESLLLHLKPGARVEIQCRLPGVTEPLRLQSEVLWMDPRPDYFGRDSIAFGVQHRQLDERSIAVLEAFIAGYRETLLVVSRDRQLLNQIVAELGKGYDVVGARNGEEALATFAQREVAVVLAEIGTPDTDVGELLHTCDSRFPGSTAIKLVLSSSGDASTVADLINRVKVFYYFTNPVMLSDLVAVVDSAVAQYWKLGEWAAARNEALDARRARVAQQILEHSRRLGAARELGGATEAAVEATFQLIAADRAYCWVYDALSETLWSRDVNVPGGRTQSAFGGIVGFVARTGSPVLLARAVDDLRYSQAIDDPDGTGDERLLAQPVVTGDGRLLTVLIAVRGAGRPEFSTDDAETLRTFASHSATAFGQMALQQQVEEVFAREAAAARATGPGLYREEALHAYAQGSRATGRPLELVPGWTRHAYWVVLSAVLAGIAFAAFGRVDEYAGGSAIVRIDGRSDIAATEPVTVASVSVQPGQRVLANQLLVRFFDAQERTELERNQKEFELALVKSLRSPDDPTPRDALARLRTQRDFAVAKLDQRSLRAQRPGVVNDVRIRAGQHLPVGTPILSITEDDATLSIVALIPGRYRPMLRRGMPLRLEVEGFRYAYRELSIDAIGDTVIGPDEAKRYLGKEVADAVQVTGPVVLVRSRLPDRSFISDGKSYNYHDGMQGIAEVRVRSEPIALAVLPALRVLFEESNE